MLVTYGNIRFPLRSEFAHDIKEKYFDKIFKDSDGNPVDNNLKPSNFPVHF